MANWFPRAEIFRDFHIFSALSVFSVFSVFPRSYS